ncbi:MAG: restriction endonuclease subunit S [Kiritimatiellae bacterium]|nr:restriction endonuclease subunit S [Kiritimatiellia bacterium]
MKSAKFKDSPLGPIPQDWEVKRLGEIGEPLMCKRVLKHQTSEQGDIPFYKIGTFGKTPDAYITRSLFESLRSKYPFPRKGDCLISAAGTIGRVVVYNGEDAYFQDSNIVWIDNDEAVVTNEYLALCYTLMKWQSEDGGIISRLYNANLKAQIIVCPPLPEQQRIAEALGEVDKLIESLDEQIEKKRLIAKGVAHDLLSGKKRLPGFKGAWREVAFKAAFISLGNNTYARECLCGYSTNAYDIHYGDVLIRFGAVVDFSSDYIPRLKDGIKPNKDFLQNGDIVFADTAEDEMVGKAVEVRGLGDGKAVSGLHTMACRPRADMFAPRFLGYYLNSDSYRKQLLPLITGSKVSSLSRANFESSILTMPDVIEQQAIADLLSEQDAAIAALEEKREKYMRIKEGMMRDLLTGKVRMKGE